MRVINSITIRYAIAGTVVLAVDYSLLNVAILSGMGIVQATTFSFIGGIVAGYLLHSIWTFRYKAEGKQVIKFSQFLITGLIGLVATNAVMYACTSLLFFHYNISKTIAVIISALWAYIASRWWVFRKDSSPTVSHHKHLLVLSPFYPPHVGGLESHAFEFNAHMEKAGWNITVWTARIPHTTPREERVSKQTIIYRYDVIEPVTGFPIPALWKPSFWKQLQNITQRNTYSHIVSRTRFFLSSLLAYILAKKFHTPHIHVEHGSYFVSQKNRIINSIAYIYDLTFGRFVLQHATSVIANSHATAAFVTRLTGGTVTPHVVYRGIEHTHIDSLEAESTIKDPEDARIVITYAGRLISGKGVDDLLVAIANSHMQQRILCLLIGDGPTRASLESRATHAGLINSVRFLGTCSRERTIRIMKASDIIINPSYTEGMPTTIIEAALCKKAIIATNVGGTSEIVQDKVSALLFPPRNVAALTNAITTLITNPRMRANLASAAHAEVTHKFLWNSAIASYEKILLPVTH